MARKKYIIGIDEVGRGCLAGPVMVAAALFKPGLRIRNKNLGQLKDSKKLTKLGREKWADYLKEAGVAHAFAKVYPSVIDRINISQAANLAAFRAFKKLLRKNGLREKQARVFLDGGLFLGPKGKNFKFAKTIIRGDEKIKAISAASVFAKVKRDKLMEKLSLKHPRYGLDANKGYGTRVHLAAIRKYGPAEIHRQSFLGNLGR